MTDFFIEKDDLDYKKKDLEDYDKLLLIALEFDEFDQLNNEQLVNLFSSIIDNVKRMKDKEFPMMIRPEVTNTR